MTNAGKVLQNDFDRNNSFPTLFHNLQQKMLLCYTDAAIAPGFAIVALCFSFHFCYWWKISGLTLPFVVVHC